MKKRFLFASAWLLIAVFLFQAVSAATIDLYPTWGIDTTQNASGYIMTTADLAKVNSSDDNRYGSDGFWPSNYTNEYIQWNFTGNLSNVIVNDVFLTFEWQRTGTVEPEARLRVWDHSTGNWGPWHAISAPFPNQDHTITIDLDYINTTEDINNLKVYFQARDGRGAKTQHDLVKLTVIYEIIQPPQNDTQEPDTNITHFTQYNETYNRRNCTNYKAYVNYTQVIGNGISSDAGSGNSSIINIQYKWDNLATRNAVCNDGSCNDNDITEIWHTDPNFDGWLQEGWHTLCGLAKDSAKNLENITYPDDCCDVCVDTSTPSAINVWHANPSNCVPNYVNESPRFSWSATDAGCAGIDYYEYEIYQNGSLYSKGKTTSTTISVPSPTSGMNYYIKVRAVDRAGNLGPWNESEKVWYDTEAPEIEIIAPEDGTWFNKTFEVSEAESDNLGLWKCYYKINDGNWIETTCNKNISVKVPEDCNDGQCIVTKKAIDYACNYKTDSKTYNIDTTAPTTTKEVGTPNVNNYYITSNTSITLVCNDKGIGCDYIMYNYNGTWIKAEGNKTTFNIRGSDGNYILQWYSVDKLGNQEATNTQKHYLDNTPPETTKKLYMNYSSFVSSNTKIELNCSDSGVGCYETCYEISNESGVQQSGCHIAPYNLTFDNDLADGRYNLYYWSFDKLNNREPTKNQTHYLDNTPPTITIINPSENAEIGCELFTFSVRATIFDDGSSVNHSKVDAELVNLTGHVLERVQLQYKQKKWEGKINHLYPAGEYKVRVIAYDNLGNNNTEERNITLQYDVFWYVHPESVTLKIGSNETASFGYLMYLCHGGNAVAMQMEKLCGPNGGEWLNPVLKNATSSKDVEELRFPWNGNFDETSLMIGPRNNNPKNGSVTLEFEAPNSTPRCSELKYVIGIGFDNEEKPRNEINSAFDIEVAGNKITFKPRGPKGAYCGNNIKEFDEECDGNDFGGLTCRDFGHTHGTLKCKNCIIDASNCYTPRTGTTPGVRGGEFPKLEKECKENWICSPWGPCVSGYMYRTCKDINECGTTREKPKEKEVCPSEEAREKTKIITDEIEKTDTITGAAIGSAKTSVGILIILITAGAALAVSLLLKKKKF
ncbi:MAG: fibronectin type III domain-containing protein [Candidatus Pacearchaeota archaeon]|nr:fibronectin type III domain-containing protein [Candidatus Pacearchaeota archaeon]